MTTATNGTPLIFRKDLGTTLEEQTWNIPDTTADGLAKLRPRSRRTVW